MVWYSHIPVGHNTLSKTVKRICGAGGVGGYKTNHSLQVTSATRLFQNGAEEQLIMGVTGHRSTEGVRTYKGYQVRRDVRYCHNLSRDILRNP